MKINCIILLILLAVLACTKEEKISEEVLIPDQLLGDTNAELLQGSFWYSTPAASGLSVGRVDNVSLSPTHSFMLSRTAPDSVNAAYYAQIYSLQMPVGHNLTLKVHIKGENLQGNGIATVLQCVDANSLLVQIAATPPDISITGTFDWTPYTIDLMDLQSSVKTIYILLLYLPNTTGTVYFDDITLTHSP